MNNSEYADIIDLIRSKFSYAVITRCSEKKCNLGLEKLGTFVALKGELVCQDSQKMCDCIIFKANSDFDIGIVELKGKNPNASEVIEKISNGKDIALDIIKDQLENMNEVKFHLLALAKGWDNTQNRKIKTEKINIRGKAHYIKTPRCGVSFYDEMIKQ